MKHKTLGSSGVEISEIGLGTWKYFGEPDLIRRGIDAGATFIDTAEFYSNEEIIGRAVRGIRDRTFIATKVSPKHFRREDVILAAENSLRRLKTGRIDLYQLHCPNPSIPIEETLEAMEMLVDQGKVRFVGVSNFSVAQLEKARLAMRRHRIMSNQVPYSLLDRRIETDIIPYCWKHGLTVIAYSPLARDPGKLRSKDRQRALHQVAMATGKTPIQVALNWCIVRDPVIAIPKASTPEHVEENCAGSGWRLTAGQVALLDRSFRRRGRAEVAARKLVRRVLRKLRLS